MSRESFLPNRGDGRGDLFQRSLNSGCLPFPADLLMFPLLENIFNVKFLSLLLHLNSRHQGTIHHDLPKQSAASRDLPMPGAAEAICACRARQQHVLGISPRDRGHLQAAHCSFPSSVLGEEGCQGSTERWWKGWTANRHCGLRSGSGLSPG